MSVRRQIIAALSASSVSGTAALYDVDHATRLVDAHAAELLAEDRANAREKATPTGATATPDFFQPGHTYTQNAPFRAPEDRPNFQCIAVATHPTTGNRRAFGFDQPGAGGPWSSASLRDEEWADGWIDVTEGGGR